MRGSAGPGGRDVAAPPPAARAAVPGVDALVPVDLPVDLPVDVVVVLEQEERADEAERAERALGGDGGAGAGEHVFVR